MATKRIQKKAEDDVIRDICLKLAFYRSVEQFEDDFRLADAKAKQDMERERELLKKDEEYSRIRSHITGTSQEMIEKHAENLNFSSRRGWMTIDRLEGKDGSFAPYGVKYPEKARYRHLSHPLIEKRKIVIKLKVGKRTKEKTITLYRLKKNWGGDEKLSEKMHSYFSDAPWLTEKPLFLESDYAREHYNEHFIEAQKEFQKVSGATTVLHKYMDSIPLLHRDSEVLKKKLRLWIEELKGRMDKGCEHMQKGIDEARKKHR